MMMATSNNACCVHVSALLGTMEYNEVVLLLRIFIFFILDVAGDMLEAPPSVRVE